MGSILVILAVIPWTEIEPGISPFVVALDRIGIPGAGTIMNFIVLTAVLSCLNSGVYVNSRVLFTLAAHGDAPESLVKLSKRRVPARAILLGSSLGFGVVITAVVSPSVVFAFLLNTSGAVMLIVYLITALAQIRLRRQLSAPSRPARSAHVAVSLRYPGDHCRNCRGAGCDGVHRRTRQSVLRQPAESRGRVIAYFGLRRRFIADRS